MNIVDIFFTAAYSPSINFLKSQLLVDVEMCKSAMNFISIKVR